MIAVTQKSLEHNLLLALMSYLETKYYKMTTWGMENILLSQCDYLMCGFSTVIPTFPKNFLFTELWSHTITLKLTLISVSLKISFFTSTWNFHKPQCLFPCFASHHKRNCLYSRCIGSKGSIISFATNTVSLIIKIYF